MSILEIIGCCADGGVGSETFTGTGDIVRADTPTLITPLLGTPTSVTLTNATGLPAAGVIGTAAILGANTFTALQQFSGTTHVGLRLNSLTTTQRDATTPAAGDFFRNSTTTQLEYHTGSAYRGLIDSSQVSVAALTVLDDATVAAMVDTLGGAASGGTGGLARLISPAFTTPNLGVPSVLTLTNATGLPAAGVIGTAAILGANTFTDLQQFSGTTHVGLRLNSLTTTQRDATTPAVGDFFRNSTTTQLEYHTGSAYRGLIHDAGGQTITGDLTVGGATSGLTVLAGGFLKLRPTANDWDMRVMGGGSASSMYTGFFNGGDLVNPIMVVKSDGGTGGNVGMGTVTPNVNAVLDIVSTTKAFMPPRMTTAQRNAIPSATGGMVIYNTSTLKLNVFTSAWESVTSA